MERVLCSSAAEAKKSNSKESYFAKRYLVAAIFSCKLKISCKLRANPHEEVKLNLPISLFGGNKMHIAGLRDHTFPFFIFSVEGQGGKEGRREEGGGHRGVDK